MFVSLTKFYLCQGTNLGKFPQNPEKTFRKLPEQESAKRLSYLAVEDQTLRYS